MPRGWQHSSEGPDKSPLCSQTDPVLHAASCVTLGTWLHPRGLNPPISRMEAISPMSISKFSTNLPLTPPRPPPEIQGAATLFK